MKWVVALIIFLLLLTFAFKYSGFVGKHYQKQQGDSLSLKDIGKVMKNVREIKDSRKEDIDRREKEFEAE